MTLAIPAIFLIISVIEYPRILKQRHLPTLAVFTVFTIISFAYAMAYALEVPLFSPLEALAGFCKNSLGLSYA